MDATTHHKTDQPADPAPSQIAFCHELIELGMQMARTAAAQAMREAEEQTAAMPPNRRRTRDPNLAFIRISREIRQLAALAARLAAGTAAAPTLARPASKTRAAEPPARIAPAKPTEPAQPDPRRAVLHAAADLVTQGHPHHAEVRATCTNLIEAEILADRRHKRCPADMLITIADTLHLDIDSIDFPPALLEQLVPPAFAAPAEIHHAA